MLVLNRRLEARGAPFPLAGGAVAKWGGVDANGDDGGDGEGVFFCYVMWCAYTCWNAIALSGKLGASPDSVCRRRVVFVHRILWGHLNVVDQNLTAQPPINDFACFSSRKVASPKSHPRVDLISVFLLMVVLQCRLAPLAAHRVVLCDGAGAGAGGVSCAVAIPLTPTLRCCYWLLWWWYCAWLTAGGVYNRNCRAFKDWNLHVREFVRRCGGGEVEFLHLAAYLSRILPCILVRWRRLWG